MSNPAPARTRRDQLLDTCRRQRYELAAVAANAATRLHVRDLARSLRFLRRVLKLFSRT
jgi:hypothetical protein